MAAIENGALLHLLFHWGWGLVPISALSWFTAWGSQPCCPASACMLTFCGLQLEGRPAGPWSPAEARLPWLCAQNEALDMRALKKKSQVLTHFFLTALAQTGPSKRKFTSSTHCSQDWHHPPQLGGAAILRRALRGWRPTSDNVAKSCKKLLLFFLHQPGDGRAGSLAWVRISSKEKCVWCLIPSAPALLHKPLGDHNCGLAWLPAEVTTFAAWQGAASTVDGLLWGTEPSQWPHVSQQGLGSVRVAPLVPCQRLALVLGSRDAPGNVRERMWTLQLAGPLLTTWGPDSESQVPHL